MSWPDLPRPVSPGRKNTRPTVAGRRFCTICGRWRLACDFGPASWADPDHSRINKLASRCLTCCRVTHRELHGFQPRRIVTEQERLARRRAMSVARTSDPVLGPKRREYQRIWKEVQRRRAGVPERKWGPKSNRVPDRSRARGQPRRRLPAAPLLERILEYRAVHMLSREETAALLGTTDRALRRWESGESEHVNSLLADSCLVGLGLQWWDVWPNDPDALELFETGQDVRA